MKLASKKKRPRLAALSAVLAAASYGAYWWQTGRFLQTTDDAYVGGDISAISSKVSGYIQQLAVQDNMAVKKGDLLIRIDDRDYRAALAKAAGEVAAQQAALADIQLPASYSRRPLPALRPRYWPPRRQPKTG